MIKDFPSRETVERLRKDYPVGCLVVLEKMNDAFAPPLGTVGEVLGVDDAISFMCAWRGGGSLSVVYGEDKCRKIED